MAPIPKKCRLKEAVQALILIFALGLIAGMGKPPGPTGGFPGPHGPPPGPPPPAPDVVENISDLPVYERWESFTTADGLPSDRAFSVRVDGDRVWVGTDHGLALYRDGAWSSFGVQDGLPHQVILSLDVSPHTGDLWIATMGGLARYSAGRFDAFTQLDSGLSNDFVHDVACDPDEPYVWAATAMGLSRLDLRQGSWTVFTEQNTPMREPWTYSVSVDRGVLWLGAWGGGVLEHHKAAGFWREYRDPDKEMEIDLLPDDGPVHDVTAGVAFRSGILWQATYFGLARYDGREWRSYFQEDSGLASNFINFVRARGSIAWLCTDGGLSATDGERWATYRRLADGRGEIRYYNGSRLLGRRTPGSIFIHNFVQGVDFKGEEVWVATDGGVSRGTAVIAANPKEPLPRGSALNANKED
jgi:ligand-binding sensor domain-containing protein